METIIVLVLVLVGCGWLIYFELNSRRNRTHKDDGKQPE